MFDEESITLGRKNQTPNKPMRDKPRRSQKGVSVKECPNLMAFLKKKTLQL